ncbi:ABC transporter permease [Demequina capsici]|uniref:ABC transporter permease n=1 Tax=Demequina capsici TaxID=3075620 RepID=A0AA96FDL0_9MICO|nr:ABC transporter permease [Demequina sp. PMTSA13]WNM28188.1 ABC transporter permease [Demequina sp. PMTSA13]
MRLQALRSAAITAAVVLASFVAAGLLIMVSGANPLVGLQGFVSGLFGSPYRIGELLVGAVPIGIVALTLIPALRAGVFSVGAEGQVAIGALTSGAVMLAIGDGAPAPVYWLGGAVAGALGGAVVSLLPAFLLVRWGVNEILSTLLLNYIAAGFLAFSLRTWLGTDEAVATPQSDPLPDAAKLPSLIPHTRAHLGILAMIVIAAAFVWWRRTAAATRIAVFAERPRFAERLGVSRAGTIYRTMLVSGLGAGLVGYLQLAGLNSRIYTSVTGGVGFSGIAVALLGQLVPAGIVLSAVLFSALTVGAAGIQSATGSIPSSIADVIKAVILLGIAGAMGAAARRQTIAPRTPAPDAPDPAGDERATGDSAVDPAHVPEGRSTRTVDDQGAAR